MCGRDKMNVTQGRRCLACYTTSSGSGTTTTPIPRSQVQLSPQNLGKAVAAACHGTGERVAGERTWKLKLAKVTGGYVSPPNAPRCGEASNDVT